jgi:hypothetical protein
MLRAFSDAGAPVTLGLNTVIIDESDGRWPAVSALAKEFDAADSVETKFSKREIEAASHFFVVPKWHHGYPQPEDEYQEWTYDLTEVCSKCNIGKRQKAPFFMAEEPRWGRHNVLQLNWLFDEYFFGRQFWDNLSVDLKAKDREVLIWRTREQARSVVQLSIEETTPLKLSGRATITCDVCGKVKYLPPSRGYWPAPFDKKVRLAKSVQEFGSGHSSWKAVICSREVFRVLTRHGQSGVMFYPCEPDCG